MKVNLPGALWVALATGLIPVVQNVINQFYPEASYAWSALVVTALGALLKGIQVAAQGKGQPVIDDAINSDGAPLPAAAPMPAQRPAGWRQILFG
jgi:hypothetical protein